MALIIPFIDFFLKAQEIESLVISDEARLQTKVCLTLMSEIFTSRLPLNKSYVIRDNMFLYTLV